MDTENTDQTSAQWTKLGKADDVREKRPMVREVRGHEIAVFRVGAEYFAISNVCPHQHAPVLAEGLVMGTQVTCPMHGWTYDLRTGCAVQASGRVRTFEVRVADGTLYLRTPDTAAEPSW